MKDTALFTQLLGLSDPWKITAITPDLTDKSITLQIDWPKGTKGACSVCHALCSVYDHREQRTWRHLDTMQFKTQLVAQVPRIHCKAHGIKSLKVPWAELLSTYPSLVLRSGMSPTPRYGIVALMVAVFHTLIRPPKSPPVP